MRVPGNGHSGPLGVGLALPGPGSAQLLPRVRGAHKEQGWSSKPGTHPNKDRVTAGGRSTANCCPGLGGGAGAAAAGKDGELGRGSRLMVGGTLGAGEAGQLRGGEGSLPPAGPGCLAASTHPVVHLPSSATGQEAQTPHHWYWLS